LRLIPITAGNSCIIPVFVEIVRLSSDSNNSLKHTQLM
jgi:hypothetical protein